MKKSILALSAAVAVSGLGFAGAANALAVFSNDGATATGLELAASGVGHYLFTPYYTAQADNNTLLSVINTDSVNGKAVKVRFRGAANSDDVLDFTLFLSPGDVWTASLKQGQDKFAEITTPDDSCTLPASVKNVPFRTGRLDQALDDEALAAHTREGYVEFLNMADVPPKLPSGATNPLFTNIKHVKGDAPCASSAFTEVLNTIEVDAAKARAAGLDNPTGGLTGGWTILRLSNISTYSGLHTAVVAFNGNNAINNQPVAAKGNFAFAPQSEEPANVAAGMGSVTADPLLTGYTVGGANFVEPLWMDLPDMSTPLTSATFGNANLQATQLSASLSKGSVINEFVSTAAGAVVPGDTDWVVSQPTRRYQVAYDYLAELRVFNGTTFYSPTNTTVKKDAKLGTLICLRGRFSGSDREEGGIDSNVDFSPAPAAAAYCGEVFTMSFNRAASAVLNATLTNVPVSMKIGGKAPEAGWATFTPSSATVGAGLPMTGFAAISLRDDVNTGNYGYTFGHRW